MKKLVCLLAIALFLAPLSASADLTFGYHIVQIGQVAMLMQEGVEEVEDGVYYYQPDGIMIACMATDAHGVSAADLYETIIGAPESFSTGILTSPVASIDPIDGAYVKIVGTAGSDFDYATMYLLANNDVLSTIVFLARTPSELTETEFAFAVRDYINTVHFIEK